MYRNRLCEVCTRYRPHGRLGRPPLKGVLTHTMPTSYRVVSEIRAHGDHVEIPDRASSVDVEPAGQDGQVRVTYLMPTRTLDMTGQARETPAFD